jgi:pilus assembly protein CpaE
MSDLAYKPGVSQPERDEPARTAPLVDVRPVPRVSIQAFCESPDLVAVIDAAARDRRMARAHVKVQTGGIVAAAEFYQSAATPNLIIVESKLPRERLEAELDRLAGVCDPGTRVVVIGQVNDVDLYRSLVQRGISEYLVAPVHLMDVIKTVSDLYVERSTAPLGRTIAFVGAKGGVGSSLVAHNVAWAISREFESDALVADLDLAFGTAGLDFNQDPSQGIAEALAATDRLDDNFLDRLLARCSDHLNLLAAPATLDRTYDFSESAFEPVIDLAQSGAPAVVLDVPHAWNAWVKRTLLAADEVVVTAEPDLANLRNAKNIIDLLKTARTNDHPPRLVINKHGLTKRPEIKIADFSAALQIEPLAIIPFDAQLFGTATNNGQMIAESDPKSPTVEVFAEIARTVTGRAEIKRPQRGGLAPLLARFTGKKSA